MISFLKFRQSLTEDAPTNSAGGGAIAGIGVGPMGEPGVHMKKKIAPGIGKIKKLRREPIKLIGDKK